MLKFCKLSKYYEEYCRTIVTAKIELFVVLVSSLHPLINFTKNSIIGVVGVLDPLLEYYSVS